MVGIQSPLYHCPDDRIETWAITTTSKNTYSLHTILPVSCIVLSKPNHRKISPQSAQRNQQKKKSEGEKKCLK
jgi:hypothetical protein